MKELRIKDLYPNPFNNNIISDLVKNGSFNPFPDSVITEKNCVLLGADYTYNRSYSKRVSPLIQAYFNQFVIDDNLEYVVYNKERIDFNIFVSKNLLDFIFSTLQVRYGSKWRRVCNIIQQQYEELNPYSITVNDNITLDTMDTDTVNSSSKHTTSDKNSVYPFNLNGESDPVPLDSSLSDLQYEDKSKYQRNAKNTRVLDRKGNLGNMLKGQIALEEIKAREKMILLDIIFDDLDSVLTSNLY